MRRPQGHCPQCGTWRKRLQRDHIVPRADGGTNDQANIQWLCANCHEDKTIYEQSLRRLTAEQRAKQIAQLKKPRPRTAEWNERISASIRARNAVTGNADRLGRKHTDEAKAKLRESKLGPKNPMYGKKPWNWKGEPCVES